MRTMLASILILSLTTSSLEGQRRIAGPAHANLTLELHDGRAIGPAFQPPAEQVRMGQLLLGGGVGAGLMVAATSIAYHASGGGQICGDDPCGMYSAMITLVLLDPILIPAGVHIANHSRGSLAGVLFGSLVSGAAALYVASWVNMGDATLVVTPVFQIVVSALIERGSENNRNGR